MMPDDKPDMSDVTKFDACKLKHVETKEKVVMPSQQGIVQVVAVAYFGSLLGKHINDVSII